jgi:hypothetical protein
MEGMRVFIYDGETEFSMEDCAGWWDNNVFGYRGRHDILQRMWAFIKAKFMTLKKGKVKWSRGGQAWPEAELQTARRRVNAAQRGLLADEGGVD